MRAIVDAAVGMVLVAVATVASGCATTVSRDAEALREILTPALTLADMRENYGHGFPGPMGTVSQNWSFGIPIEGRRVSVDCWFIYDPDLDPGDERFGSTYRLDAWEVHPRYSRGLCAR